MKYFELYEQKKNENIENLDRKRIVSIESTKIAEERFIK